MHLPPLTDLPVRGLVHCGYCCAWMFSRGGWNGYAHRGCSHLGRGGADVAAQNVELRRRFLSDVPTFVPQI